ncbi:MAG: hypothetical protein WC708_01875 [Lentisphaeria bacterium]
MTTKVTIAWDQGPVKGGIAVRHGRFRGAKLLQGRGTVTGAAFAGAGSGPIRLEVTVDQVQLAAGAFATTVSLQTGANPFTFFLRDVTREQPIFIPAYGVAVTTADDPRSYAEIAAAIRRRHLRTVLQTLEGEAEESFEAAARHTREMWVPTWLGISRDSRLFEINFPREGVPENTLKPLWRPGGTTPEELENKPLDFRFVLGRGVGCANTVSRRLDDGVLPILHALITDDDIRYDCTAFASLEKQPLTAATVRGTDYLCADGRLCGFMFTPEQQAAFAEKLKTEEHTGEEVVLYFRARAGNTGNVPRYAFFQTLTFNQWVRPKYDYDAATGLSSYNSGRVFCVSRLNGRPLPQEEVAVLLQPGETAELEFFVPHSPISRERALKLAAQDFDRRQAECKAFWTAKLAAGTRYDLPEPRLNEMVKAGLLHLDLVMYGREPAGTVAPTIGVYSPIGSESSPIIQFTDSMGRHALAERCLQFFLDKQHADGFIQNFNNYMLETGAALWSMGEHYRYTRDDRWLRRVAPNLIKACDYLIAWRERNLRDDLRGKGYGLMDGKVADPEDPYHIFMLNGYSYLGMKRVAEMLAGVNPKQAKRIQAEAQALLADIRTAFLAAQAAGPVVPLGDGSWIPTAAPWVEYQGPMCLMAEGGKWYSHGTFTARDAIIGPLYLVLQEVLDPREPAAEFLMQFQSDLMCTRNAAFSQPYYSPHPYLHLKRNEVKPFLKAYYNTVSGLADRQTYTFWEHFYHVSVHKTHEEGWFLMQTRWMLYLEEGATLKLLPGIPRCWLEDGKTIAVTDAASYFGPFSLRVTSGHGAGRIEAEISCPTAATRGLKTVLIRLPHPHHLKPAKVTGGTYDPAAETVRVVLRRGHARVRLEF